MTGLLHEREFSRKSFVRGGVLIVTAAAAGAVAGKASAAFNPYANPGAIPDPNTHASYGPPDSSQLDSWFVVHPDNSISVKLGKVDLGQGAPTGLAMIAAEELNHDINLMRIISNDTDITPNQGATVGSQSIQTGGKSVRAAAAAAYQTLLGLASASLGVPVANLSVSKGVVSGGGKTVTYAQLMGGKAFNVQAASSYLLTPTTATPPGAGPGLPPGFPGLTKPVSQYTIVGVAPGPPRFDVPAKVDGTYTYVHNVRVPGMVHGRIVRPRGQGAYGGGTNPTVLSVDANSIKHIAGAKVVQKGNFVGVVAAKEYDAIQAAAQLKVTWAPLPLLPGTGNMWKTFRAQDAAGQAPAAIKVQRGNVDTALAGAAHTVSQTYQYAYNGHLPIGPDCCVADVTANGARIYSNSQNIYGTRTSVATILGFNMNQVRVTYYEGSSVYGSAPYDDLAESAAIMSQLAGAPVRLQFMRWDEHGYDNYGPAMLFDIKLGADASGNLIASDVTQTAAPYYTTQPAMALTGTQQQVFGQSMSADTNNVGTQYNLPNTRVTGKSLPLEDHWFKVSFLRAPQAPQTCFAYEQAIDELAYAAKMDPYTFRMNNISTLATDQAHGLTALTWDRWQKVLTLVGQMSNWKPKVANSVQQSGNIRTGRGVALGQYANTMVAEVADLQVNMKSGKITVKDVYVAQDTGLTHYYEGVINQGIGSVVMGASRALWEEVTFNSSNVTSLDWVTYPIMRFKDTPNVTVQIVQRTDIPATNSGVVQANGTSAPASTVAQSGVYVAGSGEPPMSAIGAAIANAFFDATGVRLRQSPMTPARVRANLKAAGVV